MIPLSAIFVKRSFAGIFDKSAFRSFLPVNENLPSSLILTAFFYFSLGVSVVTILITLPGIGEWIFAKLSASLSGIAITSPS